MTRIAVVVTSYNYRDYVAEAVDSALAQTRAPAQVIVVDDGSTDGSADLLKERYGDDPRVILLCTENGGQLAAFQRGVARVDADVICFLDSDDRWEPDYLARVGAVYDSRKDVGFIISDMRWFGDEERVVGYGARAIDFGFTAISTYAATAWYGAPTSALSMRTEWARRSLQLPAEIIATWRLSADNALVYGASVLGARKYYLPTGSVGYRIHGSNGWWSNLGPEQTYVNRLRSRALIGQYARMAGLDDSCLELARFEFKTKPDPSWKETRRYAGLCLRGDAPWWKRGERALSVLLRRKKKQR
ncbi:glycosyltransferase family 2 protein [Lysobacter niabensis]|uniref:glycosyltransferase family 2 protein n=1 Tax=Agrilutibacter niabensis TaxID=380628 RepID=UPI00360B6633